MQNEESYKLVNLAAAAAVVACVRVLLNRATCTVCECAPTLSHEPQSQDKLKVTATSLVIYQERATNTVLSCSAREGIARDTHAHVMFTRWTHVHHSAPRALTKTSLLAGTCALTHLRASRALACYDSHEPLACDVLVACQKQNTEALGHEQIHQRGN